MVTPETIGEFAQLGIGAIAVAALVYVIKTTSKQIDRRDAAFADYVQQHNHETTKLIVKVCEAIAESTKSMESTRNSMDEFTKSIKSSNEIQKELIYIIRDKK